MPNKWLDPLINFRQIREGVRAYVRYFRDWRAYEKMPGAEKLSAADATPFLFDRTAVTGIDGHYFYQGVWAFEQIQRSGATLHIDVGSLVLYFGLLSTVTRVVFMDIRPAPVNLPNFLSLGGSILQLPLASQSVRSLSCLHVAEHIGLGRYGDPLDPYGTRKAANELARVLARGGNLYFSLPVGQARVHFNGHRVHTPQQILDYFSDLRLVNFAATDDYGNFHPHTAPEDYANARYSCGMFHFTRV